MTIILVTHLMDDVANFADYVYVLEKDESLKRVHRRMFFKISNGYKKNN